MSLEVSLEVNLTDTIQAPDSFICKTRVRYGETDKMGVAYYGRYLDWFEMGRTELCRAHGKTYREWEEGGILLPVVEANCRYKSSLFYDDVINIVTAIKDISKVSVIFANRVVREADGKLAAEGWTRHAFVDSTGKLLRKGNAFADWMMNWTNKV
ncbi:acyl-CoA thioester hydrolase [Synergistales bacterium]|nr:acyl-CoA thioester hydrolase [Synergistales bacterium]